LAVDMEDAVRMNVSAATVQVFIGGEYETRSVHQYDQASGSGNALRRPDNGGHRRGHATHRDAKYLRLAGRICAELGAQIVKTYYCPEGFETVTASCPVPNSDGRRKEASYAGGSNDGV